MLVAPWRRPVAGSEMALFYPANEVPYFSFFSFSGITAIVLGIALALAAPTITKLVSGIR